MCAPAIAAHPPAPRNAATRLLHISLQCVAERIKLLIAYVSSTTAARPRAATAIMPAHGPAPSYHTPDTPTDDKERACHRGPHLPASAPEAHAEHSHSRAVSTPPAMQSLSEASEPDRARPLSEATKPGQQRALERIAKEPAVKGWHQPLKRRKLRQQQAAGRPGTEQGGRAVESSERDQEPASLDAHAAMTAQAQDSARGDPLSKAVHSSLPHVQVQLQQLQYSLQYKGQYSLGSPIPQCLTTIEWTECLFKQSF